VNGVVASALNLISVVVFIVIDAANYLLEPRGRERM
jgi:hypothetical protein